MSKSFAEMAEEIRRYSPLLVDAYRIELGMRRGDLGRLLGGKTHMAARRAAGIPNDVLTGTTPIDDEDQEQYWRT